MLGVFFVDLSLNEVQRLQVVVIIIIIIILEKNIEKSLQIELIK